MADEQAVALDLIRERFDPKATGGAFIEAEHQARYQFAAPAVASKLVLDASCGVGWGTHVLFRTGAAEPTGIDISPKAIINIEDMISEGTSVVLVSHDLAMVRTVADPAIWLDHGKVAAEGDSETVAQAYEASVT